MYKYDRETSRNAICNWFSIITPVEEIIDSLSGSYSNIIFMGIGGTEFSARQTLHTVRQCGSKIPLYVVNAADYICEGNPLIDSSSIVFIDSVTGDTKELVEAVRILKNQGIRIVGYVENQSSPLYGLCDKVVSSEGAGLLFWYITAFRLMKNAGEYNKYEELKKELSKLPDLCIQVQEQADEEMRLIAEKYSENNWTYVIGSGNLEDWAKCYGMCIMEEMLWMPTRPISAAGFFHGCLEVVDRKSKILLFKSEDKTRSQTERVENFVNRICENVEVIDCNRYSDVISEDFKGIMSPFVAKFACMRLSANLELIRKHPMEIRRYYRKLVY